MELSVKLDLFLIIDSRLGITYLIAVAQLSVLSHLKIVLLLRQFEVLVSNRRILLIFMSKLMLFLKIHVKTRISKPCFSQKDKKFNEILKYIFQKNNPEYLYFHMKNSDFKK